MVDQPLPQSRQGYFLVALAAVIFGSIGVTTKGIFAVAQTNALSITLIRALLATVGLLLLNLGLRRKLRFSIHRADLPALIGAGVLMAFYQVSFVLAVQLVNVTIATLVTLCITPVCAALLSPLLLKERMHPNTWIALAVALVGVVLLVGFQPLEQSGIAAWLGIGLALLTALGSALFQITGRGLSNRYPPLEILTLFFVVAALCLLPVTLASGLVVDYTPLGWLLLLYLGIGISVTGYFLLLKGLRTTPATIATIIGLLEPLTGTLLAWFIFDERLGVLGIVGAALLLAAMVIVFRSNQVRAEPVSA